MKDYDKGQVLDILNEYLEALENEADSPPWSTPSRHDVLLYSRYIWTLEELRFRIFKSSENPLMIIDRFRSQMLDYSSVNEMWSDCVDCCDSVIDRVV